MKLKKFITLFLCLAFALMFSISASAIGWKYYTTEGKAINESDDNYSVTRERVYNFLMNDLDLNKAAACGVLGNFYCECGFQYWLTGKYNGLCQWEESSRWTECVRMCGSDLEGQLKFIKYELENGYKSTYKALKQVTNNENGVYEAEKIWRNTYERCGDQAANRRQTAAINYFRTLKDTESKNTETETTKSSSTKQTPNVSNTLLKFYFADAFESAEYKEAAEQAKAEMTSSAEDVTKPAEDPNFSSEMAASPKKTTILVIINVLIVVINFICLFI